MADYYPLLVRAISGLSQNTGESRKSVYDRARAALLKQLRSVEPPLPEGEILRERQSLEDAIRRVEAEQAPEPAPETEPDGTPEAPATDAAAEADGPARASASPTDALTAARALADKALTLKPTEPTAPKAEKETAGTQAKPGAETKTAGTETAKAEATESDATESDADMPLDEATVTRPTLGRGRVAERQDRAERHERPRLPAERDATARPRGQRTLLMVGLIGILIAGGAYAVVNRETLFGGTERPAQATAPTPEPDGARQEQPKSADRVAQSGAAPAQRPSAPAPRQGTTAQRAYLFEESAGAGAQGLQTYEGTVTWKTETFNAGPGLPPDVGIRADVQIPGRLGVTFTLRRNADAALPASHTIEISFALPPDFAYGGISNVPGIRMKQTESAQGAPLAGLSVRVNPTYFLVGLSAVPADKDRNLQLLQTRPWIDIPLVYTNNKRAILAFEKGPAGDQAFQDAFSAWGELLPQTPPPMSPVPPSAN